MPPRIYRVPILQYLSKIFVKGWFYHTEFVIMMVRTERKISLCMAAEYIIVSLTWLVIVVGVELGD